LTFGLLSKHVNKKESNSLGIAIAAAKIPILSSAVLVSVWRTFGVLFIRANSAWRKEVSVAFFIIAQHYRQTHQSEQINHLPVLC
jgi:hypothetical protein